MSNYRAEALNPKTFRVENADWVDNHFGNHIYGVKFDDGAVYHTWEVGLLAAGKRLEDLTREIGRMRAIVRVNLMRCEGATHEEIDRILDGGDAVGGSGDPK